MPEPTPGNTNTSGGQPDGGRHRYVVSLTDSKDGSPVGDPKPFALYHGLFEEEIRPAPSRWPGRYLLALTPEEVRDLDESVTHDDYETSCKVLSSYDGEAVAPPEVSSAGVAHEGCTEDGSGGYIGIFIGMYTFELDSDDNIDCYVNVVSFPMPAPYTYTGRSGDETDLIEGPEDLQRWADETFDAHEIRWCEKSEMTTMDPF